MAMPDLAPGAPSRVVTVDATILTKDAPRDGSITFTLEGDLRVPASGRIIAASQKTVTLADGQGEIRLPTIGGAVADDAGDSWYILVKKSWLTQPYAIRVPAGTGPIALGAIAPAQITPAAVSWALSTASVTVKEGPAAGSVQLQNGNLAFTLSVPRGLPGPGAVATDEAVGALVEAADTETSLALSTRYQRGYNPRAYGVKGDGTTDDTAAWNALLAAVPAGAVIRCEPGDRYRLSGTVSITKPVTIQGGEWLAAQTGTCLHITSSNVTIDGARITADTAEVNTTQRLIYAEGTSSSLLERVQVRNVTTRGGRYIAVALTWCRDFDVQGCDIADLHYAGIMVLSGKGGTIRGNSVRNLLMGGSFVNAYGIAVSDSTNNLTGRSEDVTVDANLVSGVPGWEGIDTHSGINLRFTNNVVIGCRTGIAVVPGNASRTIAPENIVVTGNQIIRSGADDDKAGIQMIGIPDTMSVTGVVASNSVRGYSTDMIVAYHDYTRLIVDTQSTDAGTRMSPHRQQFREWNVLTTVTVTNDGSGTRALTFPSGWFSAVPLVQVTKQEGLASRTIPYVADITATGCTVGLYDPTNTAHASPVTVTVAVRVTQANPRNGGGTAGI